MDNYIGRVLNERYELQEVIGVGGMAVVYKAIDLIDNKTVAVKILKEEYNTNVEFRRRFRNESKAIAMLSHQNIVKVCDVSFGESMQYIVMEYIEGITLKEYIQNKGSLDWREAMIFTAQILKGLRHAHDKGVIHRDIKPQNIMLLSDMRTIKVADFGIARLDNKTDTKTLGDGSAIGSVHYISPEQARAQNVDKRTDIYSVGVVLYEMITGTVPFQAENAVSVALMQVQNIAAMPRSIKPNIPVGMEQIIMKAMQKRPSDRYQSASEMLLDLDSLRKNPNIRFDYSYDSQEDIESRNIYEKEHEYASGAPVGTMPETVKATTVITQEPDEYDYEDEMIAKKSYTLPILFSIILAFILIIVGVAWFFFTNTREVVVPEFVGKYIDEIREDDDYKYFFEAGLIEENLVYTTEYKEGYIFYQSEKEGTKMQVSNSTSSIIKLNIAYTSESMTVPTLAKGAKLQEARGILQKMGFKVKTEAVVDSTVPESTVLKMNPESGKSIAYGSTITIYYAIPDAGKIAVPGVVGDKLAVAKQILEDLGLKVKIEYEEVSDSSKSGVVIKQSIEADTTVIASDTEITIVVGTTSDKTVSMTINLPNLKDMGEIYESVYVYVGGSLIKTYSSMLLDGSELSIDLMGSSNEDFKIYVGDQLVCSGSVDFTAASPSITNKKLNTYKPDQTVTSTEAPTTAAVTTTAATTYSLPSYSGKEHAEYFNELVAIGFDNINIVKKSSDTVPKDQIISVSAAKTTFTQSELLTAEITIYVSTGPEG